MHTKFLMASVIGLGVLAGCAERELILPGERLGVRDILEDAPQDAAATENVSLAANVPAARTVASWPQSHVSPSARTLNSALSANLTPLWSTSIGQGDSRRAQIITDPVVAERCYRLVMADREITPEEAEKLWQAWKKEG